VDPREELAGQLRRLVDRLHGMALTRLAAAYQPEPTRVVAGRAYAQLLADAATAVESPQAPVWRDLPEVSAAAVGDLVAVSGHDLLQAVDALPGGEQVPVPTRGGGRTPLPDLLAALAVGARDLRVRL
jgi:hypothetical protein